VAGDTPLFGALDDLARHGRLVFFTGLPGTGKSLMIHQLAHLAGACGRQISLLQWDTARPPFEASAPGRRYPQVDGVTHGIIRVAVGRWARHAVARWHTQHPGDAQLLIGETPLVGHRLVELARPLDDAAEPVLNLDSCRFVVPVPSRAVRQHLEAERERRAREPLHEREKEDAPPHVLRALWQQLASVAPVLHAAPQTTQAGAEPPGGSSQDFRTGVPAAASREPPYDPDVYQKVYLTLLSRRHSQVLPLDVILPASELSAYDFTVARDDLLPGEADAARFIREAEEAFPDAETLEREIEHWYE
jgi:hypothetical protein